MISNEWVKSSLAIGMYLSCFIVTFSIFRIPLELSTNGIVPIRIIVMLFISLIIWGLSAYFSEEPAWKTIIKLLSYSLALSFLGVGAYGLGQSISIVLGESSQLNILGTVAISIFGFAVSLGIGKCLKSKWLN